jgi:DNA-directed RNA polymerase specialized sigma24 family protein
MVQTKLSSNELVRLIGLKSRKGAEALYDQYAAALLLAIFRIVPQKEKAEMILEKTYVWIWLNIDQYNEQEKSFLAWMIATGRSFAQEIQEAEVVEVSTPAFTVDNI